MRRAIWMDAGRHWWDTGCWICALRGGGHGGPVYWFQRWHLERVKRSMP